ncbi:MAG: PQQ-binding-like beta-propeller repeat protein [Planctomycetes bacterium]|nr:PQQ-binding-like beta-propeller repeat protein [Planctomycetota bacterium]
MNFRRLLIPAALLVAIAAPPQRAAAQEEDNGSPIYVESDETAPLLSQAAEAETKGNWDVAIEKYQRALREHPDQMAPVGKDGKMWRSVRQAIFERISKMPEEGLAVYMAANDAVAKSLYEQAMKEGGAGLERVANEYFFTSVGDDAAVRLADLCAEQGRLQDAMYYWERTVRLYPRPDVPMAAVLVKWGAATRRAGDEAGWAEAKKRLGQLGDAKIVIFGKETTATEAVALLEKIKPAGIRVERGMDWPRIGGNNSATRVTEGTSRNDVRLWTFPGLTGEELQQHMLQARQVWRGMPVSASFLQAFPAAGPGGEVVVADGAVIWALADDGKELWVRPEGPPKPDPKQIFVQALREQPRVMSMVAPVIADGRVIVNFLPRSVNGAANEGTSLAAYSLDRGDLLWTTATASEEQMQNVWFGSPPVVYGGRVYAAVAAAGQGTPSVELIVLDARTGKVERRVFLCEGRHGQNPWGIQITEAPVIAESGGVLIINTNLGAVAAIQAATCEVLWLTTYIDGPVKNQPMRRMPQVTDRTGRGLSPIVILGNRACFVAGDSDNYFEYDMLSGKRLLAIPAKPPKDGAAVPSDPVRWFAGIRDERAWFQGSISVFVLDLNGIDRTRTDPEVKSLKLTLGSAAIKVAGRGFLTATQFFLPLENVLNVYDIRNYKLAFEGKWQDETKRTDAGTVVVAGNRILTLCDAGITCFTDRDSFDKGYADVLASATPDLLKLEKHADVLSRNPRTFEGAIADYERIATAAATADPLRAVRARTRIMELHRALGDAALKAQPADYLGAIDHFHKAVQAAPAEAALGDVFRTMGDCYERLENWKDAVAVYQEVIEKYGDRLLTTEAGLAEPVRRFAEEKIRRLVTEHGPELYRDVEQRAKDMLEKLKQSGTVDELKKWLESFPNSSAGPAAAGLLADRLEGSGRGPEAGMVLMESAVRPEAGGKGAPLVARAGELFAKAQAWERLEGAATRLERRHGEDPVTFAGQPMSASKAAVALRALRKSMPSETDRPAPKAWRDWLVTAADKDRASRPSVPANNAGPALIVGEGPWSGLDPSKVFFVQRAAVFEARDAEKDETLWTSIDPRGYFGVTFDVTADGSAVFATIVKDGAAEKGGVQGGDVPEAWDGERVTSQDHLRRLICASAGKEVELVVRRQAQRVKLKFVVGRRDADTEPDDPVEHAIFCDGGLLLLVRPSSVLAVRPETGEPVWMYCPVHPRSAQITHVVACDGRVFLSWFPDPNGTASAPNPVDKDVSLEALDAASGKPIWQYRESGAEIVDLLAVPGTGWVARCERRGVGGHIRLLDAATGHEKRDLQVVPLTSSAKLAVAVDNGRLVYLKEPNVLASYDLFTDLELSRDLGGQKSVPDAFGAGGGRAALAYGTLRRVLVASPDVASPRLAAALSDGLPAADGISFGPSGELYILTRAAAGGDRPAAMLRRYVIAGAELKEEWKVRLSWGIVPAGLIAARASSCLTWVGGQDDPLAAMIESWRPATAKLAWDLQPPPDPAGGPLQGAGQQGGVFWVQFEGRLVLFK